MRTRCRPSSKEKVCDPQHLREALAPTSAHRMAKMAARLVRGGPDGVWRFSFNCLSAQITTPNRWSCAQPDAEQLTETAPFYVALVRRGSTATVKADLAPHRRCARRLLNGINHDGWRQIAAMRTCRF
jgi:hypothetical protein